MTDIGSTEGSLVPGARRAGPTRRRLGALGALVVLGPLAAACSSTPTTPASSTTASTAAHHGSAVTGTVTSLSGSKLVVKVGGKAETISLTSSTAYRRGHHHLTSAALSPGTHVRVSLVARSTSTAKAVTILPPSITGTVTALSSAGLTVRLANGKSRSVTTSSSTSYAEAGKATTVAALKVGERVHVVAQAGSATSSTLAAARVVIEAAG